MARYRLVYEGPKQFTILDLEKPQKGHPKDSWVPNGLSIQTFSTLETAIKELNNLNGPKRKNKKQNSYQGRSLRYNKRMGKGSALERPRSSKKVDKQL